MPTILGHNRQCSYLNKVLKRGTLAHAHIFSGPEHVGKLTLAKTLAKSFFCEVADKKSSNLEDVCGDCTACIQIEENKHADIFLLDSEHTLTSKKEVRSDIPIEDIRELKHRFSLKNNSKWRVVIINEAERLSDQAANSFLKLLEEPGENSLFILVTRDSDLLLPTIVSRAQRINFGLVADSEIRSFIEKQNRSKADVEELTLAAQGRPGMLFSALSDKSFFETVQKRTRFIDRLLRASIPDIFRACEKIAADTEAQSDVMYYLFGKLHKSLITSDTSFGAMPFISLIKKLDRIQFLTGNTNVNPRLALETLFLEARKAYTK